MRTTAKLLLCVLCAASAASAQTDPLGEYMDEALRNNLQVRLALADSALASGRRSEAAAAFYPRAGLFYRHTRMNREISPDFLAGLVPGADSQIVFSELWQWQAGVQLDVPLYMGGALRRNLEVTQLASEAAGLGVDATERLIRLSVVLAYLEIKRAGDIESVQRQALVNAEEHLRVVSALLEQGMVSQRELKRAQALVSEAQRAVIAAANAVELAKSRFNFLLNRELDAAIDLSSPAQWGRREYTLADASRHALASRPELAAGEKILLASDKSVELVRSAYFPSFSVRAEGGMRDGDFQAMEGRDWWQISFLASYTLFDRTRGERVATARVQRERQQIVQEQRIKQIELDVTASYLRMVEARQQHVVARRAREAAEEALRVARLQFEQGIIDQVTYLDAELAMTGASTQLEQARYAAAGAEAQLRFAAGYSLP